MIRRNFIGIAFGRKGTGKTHLLNRYRAGFPRVLTFDATGERAEQFPGARICGSVDLTLRALEAVKREARWHVIALIDPEDAASIFRALAPSDPAKPGYSRAVGGMCAEMPELDQIAPNSTRIAREVRNAFQRGRHHALSILGDTQRPHLVNRICSGMADVLIAFEQHEPRDREYLADVMSEPIAAFVPRLVSEYGAFAHLRYFPSSGIAEIVNARGVVMRRVRSDGMAL